MRLPRAMLLVFGLAGLGLLGGCGPAASTVQGEVKVDGKALAKGVISYVPADGTGTPATANVVDGKYDVKTTPGNKRVQISAPLVVGKRPEHNGPGAPLVEITAESLPDRYNSKSELAVELKPGSNTKDWAIETKKR